MVSGDGQHRTKLLVRIPRPGRAVNGVLGFGTAAAFTAQIRLELITVLPQIMQQPGQFGLGRQPEWAGKLPRKSRHGLKMILEQLPAASVP